MSTKKLYLFYFLYGAVNAIAIQMIPLIMAEKGYTPSEVTLVLTFVFIAALFQPIIGLLSRSKFASKQILQVLVVAMLIFAVAIYLVTDFKIMLLMILLFSIARSSISPIYDSYTTIAAERSNVNYGLVRSGASFGFGVGMAIYTFIASIFNLNYSSSLLFSTVLLAFAFMIITRLPQDQASVKGSANSDQKTRLFASALLIMMYVFYFGALNIRLSYLSTFYIEFGYSTAFISLGTFVMVIPEIIFLPLYNRLFSRFNKELLLFIAIALGIVQIILYIAFTSNPTMLIVASLFNGFQIMIFFPTYFGLLQKNLGPKNSAFGFIMNMTLMSIFVGIVNTIIIRPLYVNANSTIPIFILVIFLQIIAFVPLAIYYITESKSGKI